MDGPPLYFLIIAGPNGAGKSTCAAYFLPVGVPYLNADDIARSLADRQTPGTDFQAARIALERMDEAESRRKSFATETTLASNTLASRARRLRNAGYHFHLVYLWSPSPAFSIARVARRVELGGHSIPEDTIRRRWLAGLKNFFSLYRPIADEWDVLDNSSWESPRLIATGRQDGTIEVVDAETWNILSRKAGDAT